MNIEETIQGIEKAINALKTEVPRELNALALTSKAKIQSRVQEEGLDGEQYSDNPLPDHYFFNNSPQGTTIGGKSNVQRAIKEAINSGKSGLSYRQYKDVVLGIDKVNLTLSGQMWGNTGITEEANSGEVFKVVVGGKTERSKDLISKNADKYGDFLSLTSQEEKQLDIDFENKVDEIIDRFV